MVESAEDRRCQDPGSLRQPMPVGLQLDRLAIGRIRKTRPEARVRSGLVVVAHVLPKHAQQVPAGKRDEVVEAVPADGTDEPLAERVRLGRPKGRPQRAHAEAADGLVDLGVERAPTVVDQEPVAVLARDRLPELLPDSAGRGMCGRVEVTILRLPISATTRT